MERKNELRDKALAYCLARGVSELSLRPIARQIGTSARLLIYHFGSRDGLIGAVMNEARERVQASFAKMMSDANSKNLLRKFWDWTTDPGNSPYLRLMFEVQMLALQNPAAYSGYLQGTSSSWLAIIEPVLPPSADRRARATLCVAVIDGLVLEFLSTGDLRRTTAALEIFRSMLGTRTRSRDSGRPAARRHRLKAAQHHD